MVLRKKLKRDIGPYVTMYFKIRTIIHQLMKWFILKMVEKNRVDEILAYDL